jgi:hypothetical protein
VKGIVTVLGVAVVAGIVAGLVTVGVPVFYALTIACFLTGVLAIFLGRAIEDRFAGPDVVGALGWVMLIIVPFALATAWGSSGFRPHGAVRWLLAFAIEVVLLLAIVMTVAAIRHRRRRGRRERERRSLAATQHWRYEPSTPGLTAQLGPALHLVASIFGSPVPNPRPTPPGIEAYEVLNGQLNGVAFTVFDYYRPQRLRVPDAGTAIVVPLPYDVPLFTSGDVFRLLDTRDTRKELADPVLARLVITSEVASLTVNGLPSWWFEGRTLVAVSADQSDGADNEELQADLTAVTRLATLLNWVEISRHRPAGQPA